MEKPSVSVIIPVFNAENYLEECLHSVLNQTLQNIEVIIIDDKSTDKSREIAEKFLSDRRIRYILHDKNKGVSAARNRGIDLANGEYIYFLDADDYISPNMLMTMYNISKKYNADIISCGYTRVDDKGVLLSENPSPFTNERLITNQEMIETYLSKAHEKKVIWFPWRNIYRLELLTENKIYFDENVSFGEDSLFNLYAFYNARLTKAVKKSFYYYRENPNSAIQSKEKPFLEESLIHLYNKKIEFYYRYNLLEKCLQDISTFTSTHQLPMLLFNAAYRNIESLDSNIKRILSIPMIRSSLENTPWINIHNPIGIQLIVTLSKLNQHRLIKKIIQSNLKN